MKEYLKVGEYIPDEHGAFDVIKREFYGKGYIFKDEETFYNHYAEPCYVPELFDMEYTREDIVCLCHGNEFLAEICFDMLNGQIPEVWIRERFANGEWARCPTCDYWYSRHTPPEPCGECEGPLDYEAGRKMNYPSEETVAQVRAQYPTGARVELVRMDEPYTKLRPSDRGRVMFVDDIATVHISWDRGSTMGAAYGVDEIKIVEEDA